MRKQRTIFKRLFASFFLLVMVTLTICIVLFYSYSASLVRNRTADELSRSARVISEQFDNMIRNMDQISLQIVSAQTLAKQFEALTGAAAKNDAVSVQQQSTLISKTLYSMLGAWTPQQRQINVISSDGAFIGTSSMAVYMKLSDETLADSPWIRSALDRHGSRYLTGVHPSLWVRSREPVLSLVRQLRLGLGELDAVLEVQQSYAYFRSQMEDLYNGEENRAFLFAEDGSLIYPQDASPEDCAALHSQLTDMQGTQTLRLPSNGNTYIMVSDRSELSGWTLAVLEAEKEYLAPLSKLRSLALGIAVLLIAAAIVLSYYVAQKIATPIREMHDRLNSLPLTSLEMGTVSKPELNELEELNVAFENTCHRLNSLLLELVAARSYEIQMRMLALESQMNPHFIYNTIAVIHATADERGDSDVVDMCEDLSDMLRYAMHPSRGPVSLEKELQYTESYLRLLKRRFEQNLQYEICATDAARHCMVPKLIVQPLVENCVKHGGQARPQIIRISAELHQDVWAVTVEDNGDGFDTEKREQILRALADSERANDALPEMETSGIGLTNIGFRLRLMYHAQGTLEIGKSELGGAKVVIRGGKEPAVHG